jgi:hypothetical protein
MVVQSFQNITDGFPEIRSGRLEEIRDHRSEDLCMHTLLKERGTTYVCS